jgi:hypothetical protein
MPSSVSSFSGKIPGEGEGEGEREAASSVILGSLRFVNFR